MPNQSKSSQIKSHFDDFEDFSQIIQGWGVDLKQVDCGRFIADLHQVMTPEVLITDVHFNRHLIQKGDQPPGMKTFVIMAEDATPFVWRKQEVTRDNLIVFPDDSELDAVSRGGFHVYTLSLAEHIVKEKLQSEACPALARRVKQGGVLKAQPKKVQELRRLLRHVISQVRQCPNLLVQQEFQQRLCDEISCYIFNILDLSEENRLTLSFRKHARLVQGIETWLMDTDPEDYSVNELCRAFHINERTLRRIITKWYGVSPQQYLLANRLNAVRKELYRGCSSKAIITNVANRWGFWHMGRFALHYRRHFGELPSETLRQYKSPLEL